MKIGFFGDSYIDCVVHRWKESPDPKFKPWSYQLLEHYNSPVLNSGLGGSNQFYAIKDWINFTNSKQDLDYAFFTFTWPDRLFHTQLEKNEIFCLKNVIRNKADITETEKNVIQALDSYYEYIYDQDMHNFNYEMQVKWILELPEKYPNIKFVFLPNTELGRNIALKYFKNGLLLNFSFATISALEGEIVGQFPFPEEVKIGHLTFQNHEKFKNKMIDLIDRNVYNTVIDINYEEFKL
jgi:hypothetical protein